LLSFIYYYKISKAIASPVTETAVCVRAYGVSVSE